MRAVALSPFQIDHLLYDVDTKCMVNRQKRLEAPFVKAEVVVSTNWVSVNTDKLFLVVSVDLPDTEIHYLRLPSSGLSVVRNPHLTVELAQVRITLTFQNRSDPRTPLVSG